LILLIQLSETDNFGDERLLRERILAFLDRMKVDCRNDGFGQDAINTAQFALVAYIDEIINTSNWIHKDSWSGKPLQLELFNRMDAGEEFYVCLAKLRQSPRDNVEVLELYYMCLTMGFKGKHQLREQEKLQTIIESTLTDLTSISGKSPDWLSPKGTPSEEIVRVVTKEVPLWVIGVAAIAIGFFFYLVMTYLISSQAEVTRQTIIEVL
jgi:type VI secretion system protein ImpK